MGRKSDAAPKVEEVSEAANYVPANSAPTQTGVKFYSFSTGYDWNKANFREKMEYCEMMAKAVQQKAPGTTVTFIFESLDEFYDSTNPSVLKTKINEAMALSVATRSEIRR